jgi:NTE family protein
VPSRYCRASIHGTFHSHAHAEAGKTDHRWQALLASAAIPELFRAVHIGNGNLLGWPVLAKTRQFVIFMCRRARPNDAKPDEIWVIRINPDRAQGRTHHCLSDITDRRNELAGNLSLNQELFFVEQTNEWLPRAG